MADPRMELLKQLDEAHRESGANFDSQYSRVQDAQNKVWDAGTARLTAYKKAFVGGFIIERVLDPAKIRYIAGYISRPVGGLFGGYEDDLVGLPLDEDHAASLSGKLAINAYPDMWSFRTLSESKAQLPQDEMVVSFEVAGRGENAVVPEEVWQFDEEESTTRYQGQLKAIEWRLPTKEEIQAFGAVVTEAAL